MKETKDTNIQTNVSRLLTQLGIEHVCHSFETKEAVSGVEAALRMGLEVDSVFKTLVTVGASGEHYVFMIPVAEELNLKKAAKAAGEKSIAMIHSRELLPLTGYVHGGCSPIGMKKRFRTWIDETAFLFDSICFSAGKIGYHVEMSPEELSRAIPVETADLT